MQAEQWIRQGLVVVVSLLSALCAIALLVPHQMTYVEGYMLEQAHRLAHGGGLYGDPHQAPWIVDNFPPLWIAVLAAGELVFGVQFAFGRLLSMVAAGLLAWMLWWFQTRRGDPRWLAMAIVAIWLLGPFVVRRMLFVRMDLPALALMAAGFLALLRSPRGAWWAGAAFAAAVLCRQTSLVAPAAAFIALTWSGQYRRAAQVAAATGGLLLVAVGALQVATDGRFLTEVVLYNMGRWSAARMVRYTAYLLGGHALLVGLGALGLGQRPKPEGRLLWTWGLLHVATMWTIGKPGTASNHFLPLLYVMALHAGPGLLRLARGLPKVPAPQVAAVALAVQAVVMAMPFGAGIVHVVSGQDDEAQLVAMLRATPGPVLGENAGAILQSGHEVLLEPRTTLEQHLAGRWSDAGLVAAIENQTFTVIVTERFPAYRSAYEGMRFTPGAWQAIHDHYDEAQTFGKWQVWRPA